FRPPDPSVEYWITLISAPSGRKIRPIPMNRPRWPRYIRLAAVTVDPHERRRSSRSGADGFHVVREMSHSRKARMTPTAIRTGDGLPTRAVSTVEPVATAPQKNPVAVWPASVPIGTVKLFARQVWAAHMSGCVH